MKGAEGRGGEDGEDKAELEDFQFVRGQYVGWRCCSMRPSYDASCPMAPFLLEADG